MAEPLGQSDRHRRLRIRRIHRARRGAAARLVRAAWAFAPSARHRSKDVTLYRQGEVNFIVNAEPDSHGSALRASAWAERLRHGVPREGCGRAPTSKLIELGAKPFAEPGRADGAEHPGHRRHRRQRDLSGRPLWRPHSIYDVDFVPTDPAKGFAHEGAGLTVYRSRHPQRLSRQHGQVGGLLREALQFPRDPLFRHRGQADRPEDRAP